MESAELAENSLKEFLVIKKPVQNKRFANRNSHEGLGDNDKANQDESNAMVFSLKSYIIGKCERANIKANESARR